MDRRSNDGIADNDVRVIEKHLDMTADVLVIDYHVMHSISLVTAFGVALITSGKVIIIMHQYAHYGKNKTIH